MKRYKLFVRFLLAQLARKAKCDGVDSTKKFVQRLCALHVVARLATWDDVLLFIAHGVVHPVYAGEVAPGGSFRIHGVQAPGLRRVLAVGTSAIREPAAVEAFLCRRFCKGVVVDGDEEVTAACLLLEKSPPMLRVKALPQQTVFVGTTEAVSTFLERLHALSVKRLHVILISDVVISED